MLTFAARRIGAMVPVVLVLALVVFILERVSPVNPARAFVGPYASPQVVAAEAAKLGLNKPVWIQYVRYVEQLVRGNLGQSAVTRRPVLYDISVFLPATLELVIAALILAVIGGLLLGIAGAKGRRGASTLRFAMVTGSSLPVFLIALLAILLFYGRLHWLPATGQTSVPNPPTGPTHFLLLDSLLAGRFDVFTDALQHIILPALCLAIIPAVAIGRVLASSLQHTLRSDYVRTARAKGLTEARVVARHALRNSSGPALSIAGLQVAGLFGTVIVVEDIFAWPGVGLYTAQAIGLGDFTTICGVTLTLGVVYLVTNLIVDMCQAIADPRTRP
jgi:peptide/nickel transport system permease protein